MTNSEFIIGQDDLILVTGASGFIGSQLVQVLLRRGFRNIRCLVRSPRRIEELRKSIEAHRPNANVEILYGNLVSRADCAEAARGVSLIYHLAGGSGEKSVPDAFLNAVIGTRNLLEAALQYGRLKRFVNTSSFAVYDVANKKGRVLDESCPTEQHPEVHCDAYEFSKVKQDQIVEEYAAKHGIPTVVVRPGYVYGPERGGISGRIGLGTFGVFLHLGGSNTIPLTYIDNCADAMVLAGLKPGIEGQVFNIVDDDLPSSRKFLRMYKRNVKQFTSLYVPPVASYFLCALWERYSAWSEGQLPPAFSRKKWYRYWKKTKYSNAKLKTTLGWLPGVRTSDGLKRYFESFPTGDRHA
jgi:nucleoside-diphosphate-sugar epimerase